MTDGEALFTRVAREDPPVRSALVREAQTPAEELEWGDGWAIWARREQLPPASFWPVWLVLAGRGFGKTRAGAEWVHMKAQNPQARIALVGASEEEVRRVMVEGSSGVLTTGAINQVPSWEASRGVLRWPNGARALTYSAANAEALRGPEHSHAWCDEIAKWARADAAWDNLRMGLRQGRRPQAVVTTTPRPTPLMRKLLQIDGVAVTRGPTQANVHLPRRFVRDMEATYAGTRLGRQELDGELIEDVAGALWTRALIEGCRCSGRAALSPLASRVALSPEGRGFCRVVVGVDPPAGVGGDACGIVVAALGRDGRATVIEDASVVGQSPEGWARAVSAAAARHGADCVVAEANNGGAMVASVLRAADRAMPLRLVHASEGKSARAEPVALLYEAGRVAHAGAFPELEDELCGLVAGGGYEGPGRSPDRADALVWALTELMLGKRRSGPRVRVV